MTITYCGISYPIEEVGYHFMGSVLSSRCLVAFSVPDHATSELLESDEWVAFQNLLEKYQEEDIQIRLQAEKEKQENSSCTKIFCPQSQNLSCESIQKRIWGKVQKILPFLRR